MEGRRRGVCAFGGGGWWGSVGGGRGGEVGVEGWCWFAQTACGLQGEREAEIILRSQAPPPPSISRRGPLRIILGARLARISAVTETKVISLAFRTTGRCPRTTDLLFYHDIISPCREKINHTSDINFSKIYYIYIYIY